MKIRNWKKFQHFKNRRPPWIKLHREILEQRDIGLLSDRAFRVLVGLWLLASEDSATQGNLPGIDEISWRLRVEKDCLLKCLEELKPFLYHDDIRLISTRYQDGPPEEETETETETETEGEERPPRQVQINGTKQTEWPQNYDLGNRFDIVLRTNNIPKAFAEKCIPDIALRYHGTGETRPNWDNTVRNWIVRAWKEHKQSDISEIDGAALAEEGW